MSAEDQRPGNGDAEVESPKPESFKKLRANPDDLRRMLEASFPGSYVEIGDFWNLKSLRQGLAIFIIHRGTKHFVFLTESDFLLSTPDLLSVVTRALVNKEPDRYVASYKVTGSMVPSPQRNQWIHEAIILFFVIAVALYFWRF